MEKQKLSKLQRQLAQPSRKTRRSSSTDLRRSLGRKSVGDLNDLAAFEHVPDTSSLESCHLNADSAFVDSAVLGSPDWGKYVDLDGSKRVTVSEQSMAKALERDRAPILSDNSNFDLSNPGSFRMSEINKMMSSSIVVNRSEIDKYIQGSKVQNQPQAKRSSVESNETLEDPPAFKRFTIMRGDVKRDGASEDEMSLDIPKFKSSAVRRGKLVQPGPKSSKYKKLLDDSGESTGSRPKKIPFAKESAPHTVEVSQSNDLEGDDMSVEIPPQKISVMKRGKVAQYVKSAAKYRKILEDSTDLGESVQSRNKSMEKFNSVPSLAPSDKGGGESVHSEEDEMSVEVPVVKRSVMRQGKINQYIKKNTGKFKDLLEDSAESTGTTSNKSGRKQHTVASPSQVQSARSLDDDEVSIEMPVFKSSAVRKGAKVQPTPRTRASQETLKDSSDSEVEDQTSVKSKNLDKRGGESVHSEEDEMSVEVPVVKRSVMRQGKINQYIKKNTGKFKDLLEDSAESTGTTSNRSGRKQHTVVSPSRVQSARSLDDDEVSIEMPVFKSSAVRKGAKVQPTPKTRASQETLEDSSDSEVEDQTSVKSKNKSPPPTNTSPSADHNQHGNQEWEQSRSSINPDDEDCQSESVLPLGAEANNIRGEVDAVVDKRTFRFFKSSGRPSVTPEHHLEVPDKNASSAAQKRLRNSNAGIHDSPSNARYSLRSRSSAKQSLDVLRKISTGPTAAHLDFKSPEAYSIHLSSKSLKSTTEKSNISGDAFEFPNKIPDLRNQSYSSSGGLRSPKCAATGLEGIVRAPKTNQPISVSTTRQPSSVGTTETAHSSLRESSPIATSFRSQKTAKSKGNVSSSSLTVPSNLTLPPQSMTSATDSVFTTAPVSVGSDSVFASFKSKTNSDAASAIPPSNVPERAVIGESWSENPYVDVSHESRGNNVELEQSDEELSSIEGGDNLEGNFGERAPQEECNPVKSPGNPSPDPVSALSHLPNARSTSKSVVSSPNIGTSKSATAPSAISSWLSGSFLGHKRKSGIESAGIPSKFQVLRKHGISEAEEHNMRSKLKNAMEDFRKSRLNVKLVSIKDRMAAQVEVAKPPPKKPVAVKKVCKYFGDYRPPRRIKPKPYVNSKMYKFLEKKLAVKFQEEARIKAEDFVIYMCDLVTTTIKKKTNYHKYVFELRDEMAFLGIITSQFDYHLFIEDYLPEEYRFKAIPCYGSTKGPNLDGVDVYKPLSLKKGYRSRI